MDGLSISPNSRLEDIAILMAFERGKTQQGDWGLHHRAESL